VLSSALPDITSDITFNGPTTSLTISGNNNSRVFTVDPGQTVTISNLTMLTGKRISAAASSTLGT